MLGISDEEEASAPTEEPKIEKIPEASAGETPEQTADEDSENNDTSND